jgi:transcription elongation GreA/GreB family factor
MPGPAIDGLTDVIRTIEDLNRRLSTLESSRKRTVTFGSNYRIEVQGDGVTCTLHAVRTSDGNNVQIAP